MQDKLRVVAVCGPTGVGKTSASIQIAKKLNAEIISADSMQIYKYMDIGTAKPDDREKDGIVHHLMDFVEPDEVYSAADFVSDGRRVIEDVYNRGKLPLVVGGTGLYIDSLLDGIEFSKEENDPEYRQELINLANEKGNEYVHSMLREIDPESAEKIHPNNVKRVIRALEIFKNSGKTKTQQDELSIKSDSRYNCVKICFVRDREELYKRIDRRVDKMIEDGLVDEVKKLVSQYNLSHTASQAIGYKEVISYLNNEISYEEMIDIIKRDSRRYAKRQLTWFKKSSHVVMVDVGEKSDEDVVAECIDIINRL